MFDLCCSEHTNLVDAAFQLLIRTYLQRYDLVLACRTTQLVLDNIVSINFKKGKNLINKLKHQIETFELWGSFSNEKQSNEDRSESKVDVNNSSGGGGSVTKSIQSTKEYQEILQCLLVLKYTLTIKVEEKKNEKNEEEKKEEKKIEVKTDEPDAQEENETTEQSSSHKIDTTNQSSSLSKVSLSHLVSSLHFTSLTFNLINLIRIPIDFQLKNVLNESFVLSIAIMNLMVRSIFFFEVLKFLFLMLNKPQYC